MAGAPRLLPLVVPSGRSRARRAATSAGRNWLRREVVGLGALPPTGVPQAWQNFAPGASATPQPAQLAGNRVPQLRQNFAFSGLAVEQLGQIIGRTVGYVWRFQTAARRS